MCIIRCSWFMIVWSIVFVSIFFFNDTATTDIYTYCHTLSLHDALPISRWRRSRSSTGAATSRSSRPLSAHGCWTISTSTCWPNTSTGHRSSSRGTRSEEHTSELQSLMRISYAVFCLKKKNIDIQEDKNNNTQTHTTNHQPNCCDR